MILFNDLLQSDDYYYIFYTYDELYMYYMKEQDYENAINILNKHIQVAEKTGENTDFLKSSLLDTKETKLKMKIKEMRKEATYLYYTGNYDEAIPLFNACIEVNDESNETYLLLADIYHRNKDFELECEVLEKGIENITFEYAIHNDSKSGVGDKLENVKYYLENGKFKWDCLPIDDNSIPPKIKKAKAILKENEQRGIELLEDILEKGTFNNTVYYTLYKTYLKNGKYNSAINISDEAIDELGLYSADRLEKWSKYKDKAIAKKEKES